MKQAWKDSGVDIRCTITPRIFSIPGLVDIFEMVPDCAPISAIARKAGGPSKVFKSDLYVEHLRNNVFVPSRDDCAACLTALMCLKRKYLPIYRYLRRTICEPILVQNIAPEIFADSLITSCLLQKVMGLSDRHNDNICLSNRGELFLVGIDHILGRYKTKFGIKREKPPLFVNQQMDLVLVHHGVKEQFLQKFRNAYLVLRDRKHDILSLLFAMRASNCVDVQTTHDISDYMEFAFSYGMSDEDAVKTLFDQYEECLVSRITRMGDWIHIVAH